MAVGDWRLKIFQVTTENISISKWYRIQVILGSASEDLRLETSHETDGKAVTRIVTL